MAKTRKMRIRDFFLPANTCLLLSTASGLRDRVGAMSRLLSPVTAGVSAARHVLWYLSYHAGSRGND